MGKQEFWLISLSLFVFLLSYLMAWASIITCARVTVIALIFTAIVTPYEIAVLRSVDFDTLWVLNTIVNIVFFVDMVSGKYIARTKVSSMNLLSLVIHGAGP